MSLVYTSSIYYIGPVSSYSRDTESWVVRVVKRDVDRGSDLLVV